MWCLDPGYSREKYIVWFKTKGRNYNLKNKVINTRYPQKWIKE